MSVLDDCDVEYSVKTDLSNSVFYERGKKRPNVSWGLKVARKLVMSSKTFRALRKRGLISRKEKIWLTISSPMVCDTVAAVSFVCAFIAFLLMFVTMTVWTGLLSLAFMGIGLFTMPINSVGHKVLKKVKDRLDEQFNIEGAGRIELDWSEQDLYELAKTLSKADSNEDLKKTLFDLLSEYPTEANERINELFKMKEEVPENTAESEMVLSEIDGMLDKLFDMRDTPENAKIAEQVKQVLWKQVNRKKMSKIGVSVEKLAEISEFLDNNNEQTVQKVSHNSGGVSAVVDELNNVEVEYETAEKDSPGTEVKRLA